VCDVRGLKRRTCDIQQSVERDIVDNSSPSGEENMFLTPQLCIQQEAQLSQRDCATRLSVEILQLRNIAIVWHYSRDPTFSRFYTIPECDRHTLTDRRTNRYTTTACIALSLASRGKNRPHCTAIPRQRASVDSRFLGRPRNVGY